MSNNQSSSTTPLFLVVGIVAALAVIANGAIFAVMGIIGGAAIQSSNQTGALAASSPETRCEPAPAPQPEIPPGGEKPPPATGPGDQEYELGNVQPQTDALAHLIGRHFDIDVIGGWRGDGEHVDGLAFDVMTTDKAKGDAIAAYLVANAEQIGISNVIWWQQIWTQQRASEGWRDMEDRDSDTQNHYDHVHVLLQADAPILGALPGSEDAPPSAPAPPTRPAPGESEPPDAEAPENPENPENPAPAEEFVVTPSRPYDGADSPEANQVTVDQARLKNVATVSEVAHELFPNEQEYQRAMVIAVITMLVETGLANSASDAVPETKQYPHDNVLPGDHDSAGVYQQRVNQGYHGTAQQIMDVRYASYMFFGEPRDLHGPIPADPDWGVKDYESMHGQHWMTVDPGQVAADIQRPAAEYEYRYGLWVDAASQVIDAATGVQVDPGNPGDCSGGDRPGNPPPGNGIAPPAGKVVSPIPDADLDKVVMSARYERYPSGGEHWGVDLPGSSRWNIQSACDGTVHSVDIDERYANSNGPSGSTNYLWIDCGNNVLMGYAHFFAKDLNPEIRDGVEIGAGTFLFREGNQGNSSGYHLHYQISTTGSTAYSRAATVDPITYLEAQGVTLPAPSY